MQSRPLPLVGLSEVLGSRAWLVALARVTHGEGLQRRLAVS
jgi:hypothetical protein